MKTLIAIPIYNEAMAIEDVIKKLKNLGLDILIVNDGSTDESSKIARDYGVTLLENTKNCGKGFSIKKAFSYAVKNNYDTVILMDGDGQHSVDDIHNFLLKDFEGFDFLVGNRMGNPKGMPLIRYLTNSLMSWLISKVARQDIKDTQCGFRLLRRTAFEKIELHSDRFEVESEMLLRAGKLGLKISNVPIKTVYGNEASKINPVKDTLRFIKFFNKFLKEK